MAASRARTAPRHVHVHGAEISTDSDSIGSYAEAIALVLAIVMFLAAAWVAATPSEFSDVARPSVQLPSDYVIVTPTDTIQQPDVDGPQEVAVVVPGQGSGGTFGDPFATGELSGDAA